MTRTTRQTMARRSRRSLVIPILVALLFTLLFPFGALAVHDTGIFELDGNATSQTSDDWDKVCHQVIGTDCLTSSDTTGARAVAWSAEPNPNSTIFTGGGSKDPIDIDQWAWKDGAGGLPDKDNLEHAFAARYSVPASASCPSGGAPTCELLFFGSDRFDNSGDAQQGFWFFQNPISLGSAKSGGGTSFNGVHRNGDILVISDFSNGGTTSTITIYKWNSAVNGNLELLATSNAAKCTSAAPGDAFCGLVNPNNGTVAPWPFLDKSGNATYLNGEFYEGGINLSLLGLGNECFATVSAETRSSTSTTATLKDFVLATFGSCTSSIATTAKDGSGGTIPSGGLSIGTGSVSVKDSATLTVGGATTWSGSVSFFLCGPASTACTTGGTQIGSAQSVNQSTAQPLLSANATVTSVGTYCWRAEFTSTTSGVPNASDDGSRFSPNPECFTVNPVTPTITTSSTPAAPLGSAIDDTATLGGTANRPGSPVINPTTAGAPAGGTITFNLYGPSPTAICTTAIATRVVNVSGNGNYTASSGTGSGSLTPTSPGTYYWVATYSGDSPNTLGAATSCGDPGEASIITNSSTVTTPQDGSGTNIPNGSISITTAGSVNVRDSAVVSGTLATNPTGSVKFYLCGPAATDALAQCDATKPAPANGTYITPDGTLIPGPGSSSTAMSALAAVTSVGHYCWRADYQGDALYPASSDRSLTECFTVTPVTPTLTTSASGGGNIPATISDTATLTGTANEPGTPVVNPTTAGSPAKGKITFTVFGPNSCTIIAGTTQVDVNGDGTYGPVNFTATSVGTYTFVASYTGDSPNTLSVPTTACPDPTGAETVVATDTTLVTSQQTWLPNDSATAASGSGSTPLSGSLTIALYESNDCSGNAVSGQTYTKTLTNATSLADRTLATSNTTYKVTASKSVSWLVTFIPNAGTNLSGSSHCETTSLQITN